MSITSVAFDLGFASDSAFIAIFQTYVPPEAKDDLQLQYGLDLLRGEKTDEAFPPNPEKAVSFK